MLVLDNFGYPAARVKGSGGTPIATVDDLLEATVSEANEAARKLGIEVSMSGREALEKM